MRKGLNLSIIFGLVLAFFAPVIDQDNQVYAVAAGDVAINEIAWMGTTNSYNDEWVELYNNSNQALDLTNWTLNASDGTPAITLSGTISAGGYYLLERTSDDTVPGITADIIYTGALGNSSESLELRDSSGTLIDYVDAWYAGDNTSKATMERTDPFVSGTTTSNWNTSTNDYGYGYGTPIAHNSNSTSGGEAGTGSGCTDTTESITNVSESLGAINVYFNKCADTSYATSGNEANYNVNLETKLIERLNQATTSIDFATYEINLPGIVDTLISKAAQGVDVRVIADAKDTTDPNYADRFKTMRLYVEKMVRGQDGTVGTADDIYVFSDSPHFAVEDSTSRINFGLPSTPNDFPNVKVTVGSTSESGYLLVDAEEKSVGTYYSPGTQMHNKFAVIDDQWVFTGSWNFTVTGLYGSETNMEQGILGGNQQHVVEINWPNLAENFEIEFNEMWGSTGLTPDKANSNFNTRKTDNTTHIFDVNGTSVELYFSTGDDAVGRMREFVKYDADINTYFSIFAWSDQGLVDELKYLWEGSYNDLEGTLTGFDVKGVFDESFWNQWWSGSVDMTGRTASQESTNNPNTRWNNPAPVYQDNEDRKLHSKTMLVDADTTSDPTVIVGSTNWSDNGNNVNDENLLFIHDPAITNQFVQEFSVRYELAGGTY
ncbi:phospholipase D-like domain-containing protein [Bacillaceae bacterium S4-13-56]